jgi:hypothetical protein
MKITLRICVFGFEDLFQGLHDSELESHLGSDSEEGHKHAFIEGGKPLFLNGLFEGMDVALTILFWFGDNLDLDVFEGKHGHHLPPSRGDSAE